MPLLQATREATGGRFYTNYMEQPGVADAELGRDVRASLRRILYGLSGEDPNNKPRQLLVPVGGGLLDAFGEQDTMPSWLTQEDLDIFAAQFEQKGFTASLGWYRNIDRNWELTSALEGVRLPMPALYVGGEFDPVLGFHGMSDVVATLEQRHDRFRQPLILPGCGHWIQQERPTEVTQALLEFLRSAR
jgi:pimeloyl-ACP methyl ester carboxylesterase